jgi:hypothetical protein
MLYCARGPSAFPLWVVVPSRGRVFLALARGAYPWDGLSACRIRYARAMTCAATNVCFQSHFFGAFGAKFYFEGRGSNLMSALATQDTKAGSASVVNTSTARVVRGANMNNARSPGQQWARRQRQQRVLAIILAATLVVAQAFGWLYVFGVV